MIAINEAIPAKPAPETKEADSRPEPAAALHHHRLEVARDRTHVRNLTSGQLADLLASVGLEELRLVEDPFELDFD